MSSTTSPIQQWVQSVVSSITPSAQTTSYTFVLGDAGTRVRYNAAGAGTFTIPTNASVAFPVGTIIYFRQIGAGQLTIAGAGGVTVNTATSLTTRVQNSGGAIVQEAANVWFVDGDMT